MTNLNGVRGVTVRWRSGARPLTPVSVEDRDWVKPLPWHWGPLPGDCTPLALAILTDATEGITDVSPQVEDYAREYLARLTDGHHTISQPEVLAWIAGHCAATMSITRETNELLAHLDPEGT